ncbi:hypothetical protein DY000_02061071 [Brassica cretica]|uniref:Uncharacterized protein n=1 Tax=Brassica cretica TaxID=69181 RepID=A0ABQ7AWY9_BRACR|nr:hypothetical protein DY000_02061071 [Brassica cretica]
MTLLAEPSRSPAYWAGPCHLMGLVEGCNPSPIISPPSSLVSSAAVSVNLWVRFVRITSSSARDAPSLVDRVERSQRSSFHEEGARRGPASSGSETSSQVPRPPTTVRRRVSFDQIDFRPTIYHPGGIFEELPLLPSEALQDPRAEGQSWKNVFGTCSSHKTVTDLRLRYIAIFVGWISAESGYVVNRLELQEKLLEKAREMEGVPDLSALLKRKLQLLSKKPSSATAPKTVEPISTDEDVNMEPSVPRPKKKTTKKTKAKKTAAEENQSPPHDENASLEGNPSSTEASKDSRKKKKKKKGGKKELGRSPLGSEKVMLRALPRLVQMRRYLKDGLKKGVEQICRGGAQTSVDGALSSDDARGGSPSSKSPSEKKKGASASGSEPRGESAVSDKANSAASEKTTPISVARGGSQSEGSLAKRARVEFPDRVQFSYDEKLHWSLTPSNAQSCSAKSVAGKGSSRR